MEAGEAGSGRGQKLQHPPHTEGKETEAQASLKWKALGNGGWEGNKMEHLGRWEK